MNRPHRPHLPHPPYPPTLSCLLLVALLIPSLSSVSAQVRLADASDRTAFRSWFALLADLQFDQPAAEVTDCAALVQGRGEIRVPLAVDDHGRDYSACIEAQVIDASSREDSGNTIIHATHGPFLLTAQVAGYMFRPGQPVSATIRALDYAATPQANVRATLVLEHVTYRGAYYQEPTRTEVGRSEVTTADDGSASATLTLPPVGGSYRLRVSAPAGERDVSAETLLWVAGATDGPSGDG